MAAHLAPLFELEAGLNLAPLTEREIAPASAERISPALGWCVTRSGFVSDPVADYFAASFELNEARNAVMSSGLALALDVLAHADIAPVLLKGAAVLAYRLYPADGARVMGDLDLLVEASRLDAAVTALESAGFQASPGARMPAHHHHLPMLVHRTSGVGIELHREPLPPFAARLFSADHVFASARPIVWRDRTFHVPSPEMMVGLLVAHSQIVDAYDRRGVVPLRTLAELRLLCRRFGETINWDEIVGSFGRGRSGAVLARACAACDAVFVHCTPFAAQADKAVAWLQRGLARSRLRSWAVEVRYRCREVPHLLRAEPHRLLFGLRPAKLREIFGARTDRT